jgi:hypothetical protein
MLDVLEMELTFRLQCTEAVNVHRRDLDNSVSVVEARLVKADEDSRVGGARPR